MSVGQTSGMSMHSSSDLSRSRDFLVRGVSVCPERPGHQTRAPAAGGWFGGDSLNLRKNRCTEFRVSFTIATFFCSRPFSMMGALRIGRSYPAQRRATPRQVSSLLASIALGTISGWELALMESLGRGKREGERG